MDASGFPKLIDIEGNFYDFMKMRKVRILDDAKDDVIVEEVAMVEDEKVRKAVKKVKMLDSDGKPKCLLSLNDEICIMHRAKHPCLLPLDSLAIIKDYTVLVMPLCSKGSIGGMLKTITREQTSRYFIQISCALRYLHENRVIHGDVKPDNVLVDSSDKANLADFGHSRYLRSDTDFGQRWGGTKGFIAPEYFSDDGGFNMILVSTHFYSLYKSRIVYFSTKFFSV